MHLVIKMNSNFVWCITNSASLHQLPYTVHASETFLNWWTCSNTWSIHYWFQPSASNNHQRQVLQQEPSPIQVVLQLGSMPEQEGCESFSASRSSVFPGQLSLIRTPDTLSIPLSRWFSIQVCILITLLQVLPVGKGSPLTHHLKVDVGWSHVDLTNSPPISVF